MGAERNGAKPPNDGERSEPNRSDGEADRCF